MADGPVGRTNPHVLAPDAVLIQPGAEVGAEVRGFARASGVPLDQPMTHVYWLADGRIARQHAFVDRDEALRAAGLSA